MTDEITENIKLWFQKDFIDFDSNEGLNKDQPFELKRLNIFVGANNAGKSRFMRKLGLEINNDNILLSHLSCFSDIIYGLTQDPNGNPLEGKTEIDFKKLYSTDDIEKHLDNLIDVTSNYIGIFKEYSHVPSGFFQKNIFLNNLYNKLDKELIEEYSKKFERLLSDIESIKNRADVVSICNQNIFYINSLRSLKILNSNITSDSVQGNTANHPFINRILQDYHFTKEQIISGEDFFEFLTDSLLGMPKERQSISDYQNKLSHYFFNNQAVVLIPNRRSNSLDIKIGDDDQFPISQLGDGLQQVIILTYKAFLTKEPHLFLIEEPEMHLHAGYVKQVMKFLLNETDHYYMVTSHSNYLLDMINEDKHIALYRVDKKQMDDGEKRYETVIKRCDNDRTVLRTLGVSPSSVFLANCTIWVEGITDRLYFVQYLKKYLEELKTGDEDKWQDYSRFIDGYHYAFVEYQGSNLDHWDFSIESPASVDSSQNKGLSALLVTSNALVVADSDLQGKPRFDELKEQLGDSMIITLGKETENTLPKALLIKRFYQKCPQNAVTVRGNTTKTIHKDEHDSYFNDNYLESDKGVGMYLDDVITEMRRNNLFPSLEGEQESFTFSDKGQQGTVKGKTAFCHAIVELMQTEDWQLTEPARNLCEAIFQHIKNNNH